MAKPPWKTMFILCMCLCSLVLHNSVFYGIDTSEHEETLPLAEARGEQDSSDSHTHERDDDMTSLVNITPSVLVGLASRMRGTHVSTLSYTPNQFFPPPKIK